MPEMAERGDIVIRDARSEDAPQLVEIYDHYVRRVPSRFMRKIVCRLRLNEVSRQ